ncbi:hypothetical protein [Sphingomonas sp.]|uniref:hypothetical protein n=1 Tax=Sphingomonas sp. TaxID=28214 RepID=UPI003CC68B11
MRLVCTITLAALLAGCGSHTTGTNGNAADGNSFAGGFDQGFRTQYRTKFADSCTTSAQAAAARQGGAAAAAMDFPAICGCVADKLLATKSVAELMRGPSAADQTAVMQQCVREHPPRAAS